MKTPHLLRACLLVWLCTSAVHATVLNEFHTIVLKTVYNQNSYDVMCRATMYGGIDQPGHTADALVVRQVTAMVPAGGSHDFSDRWDYSQTVSGLSYRGEAGYQIEQQAVGQTLTGNSYVSGGTSTAVAWVPIMPVTIFFSQSSAGEVYTVDLGTVAARGDTRTETPDFSKTLWHVTDTTLTADLYREGVDKMVFATDNVALAAGGGGSGGAGNPTANSEAVGQLVLNAMAGAPASPAGAESEAHSASDLARSGSDSLFRDVVSSASSATFDGGVQPEVLTVHFPAMLSGAVIDLNPFRTDRLSGVAGWFKGAVAWLAVATLGIWIWKELETSAFRISQGQQARGNTVAGTGGQITALIAASAITVVVVTSTAALLSWSFGEISFSAIKGLLGTNPLSTLATGSLWMVNQILPASTIVTCLLARLSWRFYNVPLLAASLAVVRFVIP